MNRDTKVVTTALEAMRTNAPPGVLANVLAATGIADRYTTIAGPSGQLYVSWSERGISSVAPAADDAEFEEIHSQRVGRRTVRDDMVPQRLRKGIVRALETGKLGTLPCRPRRPHPVSTRGPEHHRHDSRWRDPFLRLGSTRDGKIYRRPRSRVSPQPKPCSRTDSVSPRRAQRRLDRRIRLWPADEA